MHVLPRILICLVGIFVVGVGTAATFLEKSGNAGAGKISTTRHRHAKEHFEVIAFDSYGTLLDVTSVTKRLEKITSSSVQFAQQWRQKQLSYTYLRTVMGQYTNFWEVTKDAFENTLSSHKIHHLTQTEKEDQMSSWLNLAPFSDVQPALSDLKSTYKLAILSNGSPRMLRIGMSNANLSQYFTSIISVDSVKMFKPHPSVYTLIEKEFNVPRNRILFVSSNSWDAIGASNTGLTSAWIQRSVNDTLDNLTYTPDYIFPNMNSFAAHFSGKFL